MTSTPAARRPAGTPTGGQFAETARDEADVNLEANPSSESAREAAARPQLDPALAADPDFQHSVHTALGAIEVDKVVVAEQFRTPMAIVRGRDDLFHVYDTDAWTRPAQAGVLPWSPPPGRPVAEVALDGTVTGARTETLAKSLLAEHTQGGRLPVDQDELDELVVDVSNRAASLRVNGHGKDYYDHHAAAASEINNRGPEAQVAYLVDQLGLSRASDWLGTCIRRTTPRGH